MQSALSGPNDAFVASLSATGDSLSFKGREPHSWVAGPEGADVIWVLSPALWSV